MSDQREAERSNNRDRWQWSVRSLFAVTTLVATCLGVWTFHYLAGILLSMVLFPAIFLYVLSLTANTNSERVKLWAFAIIVLGGAVLPPLLIIGGESPSYDALIRMGVASFCGVVLSASYGIYVLLMASIVEAIFGENVGQKGG